MVSVTVFYSIRVSITVLYFTDFRPYGHEEPCNGVRSFRPEPETLQF